MLTFSLLVVNILSYSGEQDAANNNNEKPNFYLNPMYDNKGPNPNAVPGSKPPNRTSSKNPLNAVGSGPQSTVHAASGVTTETGGQAPTGMQSNSPQC